MKLYAHQQKIIDDDPKRCGLFLGTGSGKTRIALLLARGKTLVIAPKTQVEDQNWQREWRELKLPYDNDFSLHVISKETFRRDWESLPHFDTVIGDEAHTLLGMTPGTRQRKGKQMPRASLTFEAFAGYLEKHKPERVYLCTATIIKSPMTVWAAAYVLKDDPEFKSMAAWEQFRQTYYVKLPLPGRDVWAPKKDSATKDALAELVRSLGYTGRLEDYFDVPEQTFRTIHVPLQTAQEARIKELRLEYPDPIVFVGKRHQVENGVLAGDEFKVPEFYDNAKLDKIEELAEEFPRMVIFAKYRAQIERMADVLEHKGHAVYVLTGDTKDRGGLIAEANKTPGIFIAQAQISAGWELPEYPVMVFASRTYSYVDYAQALGRIQRANNIKKNLYINLVVKGGVDEAVDKALANKQDFDERIYEVS